MVMTTSVGLVDEGNMNIYGRGGQLGQPRTNFRSPTHRGTTQNLALINQVVSDEKILEECERTTTDGRRCMGILYGHLVSLRLR